MENFLILSLMFISLACQIYNAYRAFSLNSILGFKQSKGWYLISCSFSIWAFNRLYALLGTIAGDLAPSVGGQLLQTTLTVMLAIGMYLLTTPYLEHAKRAKELTDTTKDS